MISGVKSTSGLGGGFLIGKVAGFTGLMALRREDSQLKTYSYLRSSNMKLEAPGSWRAESLPIARRAHLALTQSCTLHATPTPRSSPTPHAHPTPHTQTPTPHPPRPIPYCTSHFVPKHWPSSFVSTLRKAIYIRAIAIDYRVRDFRLSSSRGSM